MTYEDVFKKYNVSPDEVYSKYQEFNNWTQRDWDNALNLEVDAAKGNLAALVEDFLTVQQQAWNVDKILLSAIILTYDPEIRKALKEQEIERGDWYEMIRNVLVNKPKSSTQSAKDFVLTYLPITVRGWG